jgi:hypothetical protein
LKQDTPKYQHFVSQMHTTRFTDEVGRLHVFNKVSKKFLHVPPRAVFAKTHLYTIEDAVGHKDTTLETKFSALEDRASAILDKIERAVRRGLHPELSAREKADFDLFFYKQWKRVPDFHREVATAAEEEEQLDRILANLRVLYPKRIAEIDSLDTPQQRKRLLHGGKALAIDAVGTKVLPFLDSRGLRLTRITAPGECFAIGSRPIVAITPNLCNEIPIGAWLPISSDIAVCIDGPKEHEELVLVNDPSSILAFNRVAAAQSLSFAARSKPLIEALAAFVMT